jgi:hypothetical protein
MSEFVDYRMAHLLVHGSPVMRGLRSVRTADGTVGFAERQEGSTDSIIGAALLTAQCGILSLRAFSAMLGLDVPARADGLLGIVNREAVRRNDAARQDRG